MSSLRKVVLENRLGQRVRTFDVTATELNVIYRLDTRRIEAHGDLAALEAEEVQFEIIKKISISTLEKRKENIAGLGTLRMAKNDENMSFSPGYELAKEDESRFSLMLKKTSIGHVMMVAVLIIFSIIAAHFVDKKEEPQLVTIVQPEKEKPAPKTPHVQVAEHKIKPHNLVATKNAVKTTPIQKIVQHHDLPKREHAQTISVRKENPRQVGRMGALAALGGVKTGAMNAEGLDSNSLKNIRSAGVGSGGGGVGETGSGGMPGKLPGQGLIAGSAGSGSAQAQSAGGYGTRGMGGGKAGYGKINLVGGTSGLSLPADEDVQVQGGLDRDQIAAVINRNKGQIISCYEQGLQAEEVQKNPHNLSGRVSMSFVIGPNGNLTTAHVAQSSLGSKLVENCMVARMKTWQFPHPVGKVSVDVLYPFDLRRVASR